MTQILTIRDLHAGIGDKPILRGLDLTIPRGEVHAIMGPNGSGKSTLANVIMGHPDYEVSTGRVTFDGEEILELSPDERARKGLFLSFQHPVPLPGVSLMQLVRKAATLTLGPEAYPTALDMSTALNDAAKTAGLPTELLSRSANDGFSGGEKKKAEIVQMAMLQPGLAILDEIDSGLDIDALKAVANAINRQRAKGRSFLIITHYQRILDHVTPDRVHVMRDGRIIRSGDATLAMELELLGYAEMEEEAVQ